MMKFIPFNLIGDENIDEVVDIGDGGGKDSEEFFAFIKMGGAATSERGDFGPRNNIRKARLSEDFGSLANKDFFGGVDEVGESLDRVDKGGKVDKARIGAVRMEKGFRFKMVVLERVDGEFEGAFEGGAVGADVEINGFDGGH